MKKINEKIIGETCRHFITRIVKHIKNDNKSHILKHLHSTTACFDSKFDLKIKEALHINWTKPILNAQQSHLALKLLL